MSPKKKSSKQLILNEIPQILNLEIPCELVETLLAVNH